MHTKNIRHRCTFQGFILVWAHPGPNIDFQMGELLLSAALPILGDSFIYPLVGLIRGKVPFWFVLSTKFLNDNSIFWKIVALHQAINCKM